MIDEWWSSAQPITGTPAEAYLNSRGLKPGADDLEQLRWLPDFRGPEGAMLAAIRDNEGELVGLQMTFITPSGQKSNVSPVRRTHRGPHNWGSRGAVRFGAPTGNSVFICEGVEDALSVREAGHGPAIAILGINRLGRLTLPDNVRGWFSFGMTIRPDRLHARPWFGVSSGLWQPADRFSLPNCLPRLPAKTRRRSRTSTTCCAMIRLMLRNFS